MANIITSSEDKNPKLKPLSVPQKVYQDDFSPGRGNALQAGVASIFGLSLDQVPNFILSPNGYETAIRDFCKDAVSCVKVQLSNNENKSLGEKYHNRLLLLRGKSPRGDHGHVVVAAYDGEKFEMKHDPHPDETFLDSKEPYGWAMIFL